MTSSSARRRRSIVAWRASPTFGRGLRLPDSLAASCTLLEKQGIIDAGLADRMRRAMGFRNVAVHTYEAVNPRVLDAVATHHVEELRHFAAVMVARYAKPAE